MPEACNSDLMEHAATIGLNQDKSFYARCGCGQLVCESAATQDEAQAVLEAHRTESA